MNLFYAVICDKDKELQARLACIFLKSIKSIIYVKTKIF